LFIAPANFALDGFLAFSNTGCINDPTINLNGFFLMEIILTVFIL
jgi:hypothetical protein